MKDTQENHNLKSCVNCGKIIPINNKNCYICGTNQETGEVERLFFKKTCENLREKGLECIRCGATEELEYYKTTKKVIRPLTQKGTSRRTKKITVKLSFKFPTCPNCLKSFRTFKNLAYVLISLTVLWCTFILLNIIIIFSWFFFSTFLVSLIALFGRVTRITGYLSFKRGNHNYFSRIYRTIKKTYVLLSLTIVLSIFILLNIVFNWFDLSISNLISLITLSIIILSSFILNKRGTNPNKWMDIKDHFSLSDNTYISQGFVKTSITGVWINYREWAEQVTKKNMKETNNL